MIDTLSIKTRVADSWGVDPDLDPTFEKNKTDPASRVYNTEFGSDPRKPPGAGFATLVYYSKLKSE